MSFFKQLRKFLTVSGTDKADQQISVTPGKISTTEMKIVEDFQNQFGMEFTQPFLIVTALKHRSYLNMTNEARIYSNERLEFLGDAVIDLVVTHFLYSKFPNKTEGHLSKVKSVLVSKPVMADIAVEMALGELVFMNRGEEKTGRPAAEIDYCRCV